MLKPNCLDCEDQPRPDEQHPFQCIACEHWTNEEFCCNHEKTSHENWILDEEGIICSACGQGIYQCQCED